MKFRIKEIAKRKGIKQKELADKMNLSISMIKTFYAADALSTSTLEKFATALDCNVWELIVSENEFIQTSKGDVICPCEGRCKINELEFCYDSI